MPARLQSLCLVLNTQNAAGKVGAQIRRVWTLCPNDPTEEVTPALQAVQSAAACGVLALLQGRRGQRASRDPSLATKTTPKPPRLTHWLG